MDLDFKIESIPQRWVVYRRATCARQRLGETITSPAVLPGIYDFARRHEANPGPPYARYLSCSDSDCDLQVGVEIAKAIPPQGDIVVDCYAACRVVTVEFIGPYDQLGKAYDACPAYVKRKNLRLGGPCWELYHPPTSPDPSTSRTCIFWPIEV